jgi:TonB family protein
MGDSAAGRGSFHELRSTRRRYAEAGRLDALLAGAAALMLCCAAIAQTEPEIEGEKPESAADPAPLAAPPKIDLRVEADRLLELGNAAEAAETAERHVQAIVEEFGTGSREAAEAYMFLAETNREAGRVDLAELAYLNAIEAYRSADGPYSESLVFPMTQLGDLYHEDGQYDNAIATFDEARAVQRRVFGLLSATQIELIDRMTESYWEAGLAAEARNQQLAALTLIERTHRPESQEGLNAIYKYARYLFRLGAYGEGRAEFERAIRLIRDHYGDDSIELVTPYLEISRSFREQRYNDPRGSTTLRSAIEIADAPPETDPVLLAGLYTELGDWVTAFSAVGTSASEHYLLAWDLLGTAAGGDELRATWFGGSKVQFVLKEAVNSRGISRSSDAIVGHVTVAFVVDERGRVSDDVIVTDSDPPGFKDDAVVRMIRESRFRPQIINREFVRRRGAVTIEFPYIPPRDDESDEANG